MNTKVLLLLALVTMAAADSYGSSDSYEKSDASYNFGYHVNDDSSSNEFGHKESREGDYTKGLYYVQLPDGRLQKVTYYVNGRSGYVANVRYEGKARYDSHSSKSHYDSGSHEHYRPRY